MAGVFDEQGDHGKALQWYQRALDGQEKVLDGQEKVAWIWKKLAGGVP